MGPSWLRVLPYYICNGVLVIAAVLAAVAVFVPASLWASALPLIRHLRR